jgi:hypothetical protein
MPINKKIIDFLSFRGLGQIRKMVRAALAGKRWVGWRINNKVKLHQNLEMARNIMTAKKGSAN